MNLYQRAVRLAYHRPDLRSSILRLLSRVAQEEGGEEESKSKGGGPPPKWQEFLDAKYEGGKKKVKNPNSKGRQEKVTVNTAAKDKRFFKALYKEYLEWLKDADKEEGGEKKGGSLKDALGVTDAEIDAVAEKYKKDFDALAKTMDSAVQTFQMGLLTGEQYDKYDVPVTPAAKSFMMGEYQKLSKPERMILAAGHKVGEFFENKVLRNQETHEEYIDGWRDSQVSGKANEIYGMLNQMGVPGGPAPHDTDKMKTSREKGKDNKDLQDWAKEQYLFTQAFFKHIGLKEITTYRGVKAQGTDKDPPKDGDPIEMKGREVASFSTDPLVAFQFGRPVEYKVPVENIFSSYLTAPSIGGHGAPDSFGESEMMVMGMSDLKGKVRSKPGLDGQGVQSG